ncbi:unnamed protein product, partial [Thelazia callipaeda]|uniref:Uncharacterized protein n=1 Tax=Thelazia callipaeda TaxID=103827 RepID=A0A0N5CMD6_THECL
MIWAGTFRIPDSPGRTASNRPPFLLVYSLT